MRSFPSEEFQNLVEFNPSHTATILLANDNYNTVVCTHGFPHLMSHIIFPHICLNAVALCLSKLIHDGRQKGPTMWDLFVDTDPNSRPLMHSYIFFFFIVQRVTQ